MTVSYVDESADLVKIEDSKGSLSPKIKINQDLSNMDYKVNAQNHMDKKLKNQPKMPSSPPPPSSSNFKRITRKLNKILAIVPD